MRVVFIHGAFSRDGAWWWAPTAALLDRAGLPSTAVALPSCGEAGVAPTGAGPGLDDDAAATTAVLDGGAPAILAAHSYGGMVARFLHDVTDPALVRGAHDRLCAQSSAVFGAGATAAAWERVPSTYLVCADERSTHPDLQRAQARRATTVRELPAGHFPFLSRPDLVAGCIQEIASTLS